MPIELDFPVLNPGNLNPYVLSFVPQGFEFGVRIINLSLRIGESVLRVYNGRCLATAIWCISLEFGA